VSDTLLQDVYQNKIIDVPKKDTLLQAIYQVDHLTNNSNLNKEKTEQAGDEI
jgi:hypothetical protein